jgi:general secretion pathway protein J
MATAMQNKNSGFTLIEVMVAIAIFSVIAAGVYRVLSAMVETQDRIVSHADALRDLQRALWLMTMDMNQLVMRDVRITDTKRAPAIAAGGDDALLQFTRQGVRNPLLAMRSDLDRVTYSLGYANDSDSSSKRKKGKAKDLLRNTWSYLDRKDNAKKTTQVLFQDVDDVKFEFMNTKSDWKTEWPENKLEDDQRGRDLPVAIRVTLKTLRYGSLTQTIQVGDVINKEKVSVGVTQ